MKLRVVLAWCVVLSLLCACGGAKYDETEYEIYNKDGKWYIDVSAAIVEEKTDLPSVNNTSTVETHLELDSARELKRMLTSGTIPDNFLKAMSDYGAKRTIEICDPNAVGELKLPDGLTYSHVSWYGTHYAFTIDMSGTGYIFGVTQEQYTSEFEGEFLNFPNELHTVFGEETEEERNARVVHSVTKNCQMKHILYKITVGDNEIYIKEQYVVKWFAGKNPGKTFGTESEVVPSTIYIFGNNGNQYWYGYLLGFEERPSVEWLSSFRLTPIE